MTDEISKGKERLSSLEMIQNRFSQEAWTHVYTDSSASNAVRNGEMLEYLSNIKMETARALQSQQGITAQIIKQR